MATSLHYSITGTGITDLAFTDANGDPLDGDSSGLFTTDGEEVFLFTDTVNNNIVLGKTEGGDIVFAIYLEETGTPLSGAKMWTVQYESLDHLTTRTNPDDRSARPERTRSLSRPTSR